jgi:4-amino-4-deoxy-L-arabinose transferase-like glycosyltransferase
MSVFRVAIFINILAAYLVIASAFVTMTPDWQAPDEPAHYVYAGQLASHLEFPELVDGCYDQASLTELIARRFPSDPTLSDPKGLCYEYHQPPLYYLLAVPVFRLSNGTLLALRFLSVALGAGVVILAFFVVQTIFPDRPVIALGTMAFVAFVPMHLAILASVNNDALAELIFAAILLLLTRQIMGLAQLSARNEVLLGGLLGLGLVTKVTVYIALPLVAVAAWFSLSQAAPQPATKGKWRAWLKRVTPIYAFALTIASPWYIRNANLYGGFDILGLVRHNEVVVGQPRTADKLAEMGLVTYLSDFVQTTFHSFWGQFGWMVVPMDGRTYLFLTLLTLMALGGLVGIAMRARSEERGAESGERRAESGERRAESGEREDKYVSVDNAHRSGEIDLSRTYVFSSGQRYALILMGLTIGLVGLAYIGYNLTFVQFQGRYLFPALIPIGLFFSLGLSEVFTWRRAWWLAGGLGVALGWVLVSSVLQDGPDKWALLITGAALVIAVGRAVRVRHWLVSSPWLMAVCYLGLGLLALLSPFWFVAPYLSP